MKKMIYCCNNKGNIDKKEEANLPSTLNKGNRDVETIDDKDIVLKSLNEINQNQLITRSDDIKERFISNFNKYNNINGNIPINYEIISEIINNNMFDQGQIGTCYLIAGVNAFSEIPSIFDQLFIDKKYSPYKNEYSFNVFINSNKKIVSLNNKFLYKKKYNNKFRYHGNQPFKYELFLKFIEKLYAELNPLNELGFDERQNYIKKIDNISKGGWSSEIYICILGTSSLFYSSVENNEYINKIEKYINIPGNILATSAHNEKEGHQYAIKNMIEYFGNGVKKKFITLYNPWGKGNIENEFFNFNKIKEETKNFEYITNYNNEYSNTGLIKIPLNLFGIWFKYLEICCPKYGFHYKVFNNYLKENISHIYCFSNNIKQDIEIELFLDELENIRRIQNQNINVEIILSEITRSYCFNTIEKSTQKESKFYVRKNAYIYKKLLDVGNYLITISLYYEKNNYKYNLRIGGEKEYVNGISFDNYIKLSNYYINYNRQLINANDNAIISKYILLEKTYYDLKIYKIAKEIYKLIYNPYENDIEIKVQNGLKKIISIITDAYNNNLYEFQKNYENDNITINYFFKNVKEKLRSDPYNLITHNESKIIELVEILKSQANNVKVILQKYNNTTEKITLLQLKDKITGSEIKKHKFYSSIRGYLITQYGIEDCNIYQKFENTIFFKKFVLKEIPSISNENNIKNLNFYINEQIDKNDLIDKAYCDILFIVDATGSMQPFIETSIKNCVDIIEKINLKFSSLKMFKYGAIFYRDPIDNYKDEHSFFQMCTDKNKFQNLIRNVKANGGGDESEDWNGAYTIALNQINWTSLKSNKIIVHIADAGAHGNEFSNSNDRHYEEGPKFIKTIKKIAEKGFKIIAFPIGTIPIKSFNKFKEIYIAHNGYSFSIFNNLMNINNFSNITEEAINFIIAHS